MTPSRESSICPLCLHVYQALAQHLKRAHVFNVHERKLLLSMASGRVNIRRCPCPVSGCNYHSTRLDKHLQDGHPELSRNQLLNEEQAVRKAAAVQLLGCLRATNPQVVMVSAFDLVESLPDELQVVDPGVVVCQMPDCEYEGGAPGENCHHPAAGEGVYPASPKNQGADPEAPPLPGASQRGEC